MNLRVADIDGSRDWRTRVLTAPLDRDAEVRWSMRDPDGYRIEVGQAMGLVEGRLAEPAPVCREAGRADGR
jgi:hypothetical protein